MKLQKLYAIILGLALIAPQTPVKAVTPSRTSWVSSLLSLSSKTLALPLTTLSFCYRHLFAGAVLTGVAYWGYTRHMQPWLKKHEANVCERAKKCYADLGDLSFNFERFNALPDLEQTATAQKIQNVLNECSWAEWFHSTTWLPLARGGSATRFFETLKEAKAWNSHTQKQQKKDWLKKIAEDKCSLAAILACKYSGINQNTLEQDYKATSGEGSLAVKVLAS